MPDTIPSIVKNRLGSYFCIDYAASFQIPQQSMASHHDLKVLTHGAKNIFRTRGVGSSDASRPSKARHPVLNLGTTSMSWAISCLLRPRGVRVPVPWRLVRTPRVSRHLAAAPQENNIYYLHGYAHPFSFRPPSTTLFHSRASTMDTRLLRADKELSHRQGSSMFLCVE